jgi:hypothetical protein
VAGSVQERNHLLELGYGEVGYVGTVQAVWLLVVVVVVVVGQEADQVLHALQALRCSFLYSRLIVHLRKAHELHRHSERNLERER